MAVPPVLVFADLSLQQEIGDGLARRRLDTITLCVKAGFASDDGPFPLLETYVMRFVYGGKRGFADELDSIIDSILRPRSLSDIRKHIHNVSRKLTMLKNAPTPPSKWSLIIWTLSWGLTSIRRPTTRNSHDLQ